MAREGACGGTSATAPARVAARAAAGGAAIALMLALGGCGGSGAPKLKEPCEVKALAAAASALAVKPAAVKMTVSTGSNGSPQCRYAAGGRAIVANIDVTPQAYFIVERTAIEASQQFAPIPQATLPVEVDHVGLEAFWFPAFKQFETTDGVRVIQVTVDWSVSQARERAVGTAVGRTYLGKLHPPP